MTARRELGPRRPRRGAVTIVAAVAIVAMTMLGAVAIDVSRLYTRRNALQTAADAGALAGAMELLSSAGAADPAARSYAALNRARQDTFAVRGVRFGVWDPATQTFTPVASPTSGDAVEVTVGENAPYIFARVLGAASRAMTATAVAWSGPSVPVSYCAKPWAITYDDLLQKLGKRPTDSLTRGDVRRMRDTTGSNKMWFTLHLSGGSPTSLPGNYQAVVLPPGHQGASAYERNLTTCNTLTIGDVLDTEPGAMTGPTLKGAASLCRPLLNSVCYNANGTVGVPIEVPVFRTSTASKKGGRLQVRTDMIAAFMVTRVEESNPNKGAVTGYLFTARGHGPLASTPTPFVRPVLVQ